MSPGLLALWWPDRSTSEWLSPGRHESDAACTGLRVEVQQRLSGERGRMRSWVLMDACPMAWEIESVDDDKICVKRLVLRVTGIGAVR